MMRGMSPPTPGQRREQGIRDKALTFHWQAPAGLLEALGMHRGLNLRRAQAQASILAEAVLAHAWGRPAVSYSRRREFYAHASRYHGTAFTFDMVVPAVDFLAQSGLIENQIAPGRGPSGRQSTFSATDALLAGVPDDFASQVRHTVPELVWLRDAQGRPAPYRDTTATCRMRRMLIAANDAIHSCRIGLGDCHFGQGGAAVKFGDIVIIPGNRALHRVFNVDFTHGGRLYGAFWQQLPKALRARLRIDGDPVVEHDFAQMHPRMLYGMVGKVLEGDAYALLGWDRPVCKKAFNILLNAPDQMSAQGALARELGAPDAMARAKQLILEMKLKHSPVARYFHSGVGLRLQCRDAQIAEAIISAMLKYGVVTLPVHDSFIVRERYADQLEQVMDDTFQQAFRFA
jgi:hypothetical protein